jgi:hypothetical protein
MTCCSVVMLRLVGGTRASRLTPATPASDPPGPTTGNSVWVDDGKLGLGRVQGDPVDEIGDGQPGRADVGGGCHDIGDSQPGKRSGGAARRGLRGSCAQPAPKVKVQVRT